MSNPIMRALVFFPLFCLTMLAVTCVIPPVMSDHPAPAPAPCIQADERIELHDAESVTTAGLEAMYGAQLLGGPND